MTTFPVLPLTSLASSRRWPLFRQFLLSVLAWIMVLALTPRTQAADVLYESDTRVPFPGQILFTSGGTQSIFASGLSVPYGLAFDSSGNLYVADHGVGEILKFTRDGTPSMFASDIGNLVGLAIDASDNVYATDIGSCVSCGQILKFTPGGARSIFASGLSNPMGLAFDSKGNLYAANYGSGGGGDIIKITPQGTSSIFVPGLQGPYGLAFDSSDNLYVTTENAGLIYKLTPGGLGSEIAAGLSAVIGVAVDSSDTVYVTDIPSGGPGEVLRLNPDGTRSMFASGMNHPTFIAFAIDKTPPTVTCSVSPDVLWPPNDKLVTVTATVTVTDAWSGPAGFILTSVTSNEPTAPGDIQGFTVGTPDTVGQLRATRLRPGNGRLYTLTYQGLDVAGNSSTCSATVGVPRKH
jgi:sugar lactone lactonase YvrE